MGPLHGIRVVEIGSIGPGPFAAMVLADLGADIIRIERPGAVALLDGGGADVVNRGRPILELDLKSPAGRDQVLELADRADALIEGFRPGVMERLGLGPDVVAARNARLVYARMTGYGQDGPLARVAGHDINYISIAGALGAIAREGERPLFPLNLLGDYGGGMLLALGVVCGVLAAQRTGKRQVVDAAMVDGVALLSTAIHGLAATGGWNAEAPGTNVLDSGAHFYEVYETSDGGFISVGAIEPQFYTALLDLLGFDAVDYPQWDRARWPDFKAAFAARFRERPRDEWAELLERASACATPVLGLTEAATHAHVCARETFIEHDGVVQPGSAPRFSGTPAERVPSARPLPQVLADWGIAREATNVG